MCCDYYSMKGSTSRNIVLVNVTIFWIILIRFNWIMFNMVNNKIILQRIQQNINLLDANVTNKFTLQNGFNGDLYEMVILFGLQ